MNKTQKRAFTLIELLVVITIIVVLLALLTPALDRAIYQAELAVCGSQLHGIAQGVLGYAFEHKRRYPHREAYSEPHRIAFSLAPFNDDDRPVLRLAFSMKFLNDPLNGAVDLDSPENSIFYGSYYLWFGFGYDADGRSDRAMNKVGDRFTWTDDRITDGPVRNQFDLLASEHDVINEGNTQVHGNHPDLDGKMHHEEIQDGQIETVGFTPPGAVGFSGYQWTVSRWLTGDTHQRGALDMNFAHDDGSVSRHNNVEWDEPLRAGSRLARVPHHKDAGEWGNDQWSPLPKK